MVAFITVQVANLTQYLLVQVLIRNIDSIFSPSGLNPQLFMYLGGFRLVVHEFFISSHLLTICVVFVLVVSFFLLRGGVFFSVGFVGG